MRGISSTTKPLVEEQMHRLVSPLFAFAMSTVALAAACSRSSPPATPPAPAPVSVAPSPVLSAPPSPVRPLSPDTARTEHEYRGSYTRGWEASWFAPCDAPRDDALWWVTLTEHARLQRDSLLGTVSQPPTGALAVRWRGTISKRMPAGQMGRGTRYMLVTEVLEVRPLSGPGMCLPPGRSS